MRIEVWSLLLLASPILALSKEAGSPVDAADPVPEISPGVAPAQATASSGTEAEEVEPPISLFQALKKTVSVSFLGGSVVDVEKRARQDAKDGIDRVTDSNYNTTVEAGAPEDTWVMLIHGSLQQNAVDQMFYEAFNNATKMAREATGKDKEELEAQHIHWARIDYLTEVNTCTKMFVFKPPMLVIANDQGKTLRFITTRNIPPKGEAVYQAIKGGTWVNLPVWNSAFGPNGKYAVVIDWYLQAGELKGKIPGFVWLILSGLVTQSILGWMHKKDDKVVKEVKEKRLADKIREIRAKDAEHRAKAPVVKKEAVVEIEPKTKEGKANVRKRK